MGVVPAVHVVWEDKNSVTLTPIAAPEKEAAYSSPFASRSSFTSGSSSFPRSSFAEDVEVEEETMEPEPMPQPDPAEAAVEVAAAEEDFTAPRVSASARDPEDDKWTSFPDISFPGSK